MTKKARMTPEESWRECEMHAREILGDEGFEEFMREMEGYGDGDPGKKNTVSGL